MSQLVIGTEHSHLIAEAVEAATPENTRRAYATGWRAFEDFCASNNYEAYPASDVVVAAFLAQLDADGFAPSTIAVYHAAVMNKHGADAERLRSFGVRQTMRGIRRQQRGYKPGQARALTADELLALSQACGSDLAGKRDRFAILTGATLGLRYSDLAALRVCDVAKVAGKGYVLTIPYSKTSDEGIDLPLPELDADLCDIDATLALGELLETLPGEGSLLRGVLKGNRRWREGVLSANGFRDALRARAIEAGVSLDGLSAHSLRATFATGAYAQGISEERIALVGRWASVKVQRRYNRASMWNSPASTWLGQAFSA